jgi:alkylhydroperoxidase/carboxymuconolactone decarboxylase family protein YurZ
MAYEQEPLLDAIAAMTAESVARVSLSADKLMLVRLAGLVAVDAPEGSYLMNLGAAAESGLTLEDARDVLIALAPIVGIPRVVSATGKIADALGIALALEELEEELEEEAEEV